MIVKLFTNPIYLLNITIVILLVFELKLKEPFKSYLNDFLDKRFVEGLVFGSIIILLLLLKYEGLHYAFRGEQIHAHSIIWLLFMLGFYHSNKGIDNIEKFKLALCYTAFVFEIHEFFWITSTIFNGIMFNEIIYPDIHYYFFSYSRLVSMLCLLFIVAFRKIDLKKISLPLLILQIGLWAYTIFINKGFVHFIFYNILDFLPYYKLNDSNIFKAFTLLKLQLKQ